MQKTILFDLDGTLSNTAIDLIGSVNILLARKKLPPLAFEQARITAGQGGRALIELGYKSANINNIVTDKDITEYINIYKDEIKRNPALFIGVRTVLDYLKKNNWVLGICSNKPENLAAILLTTLDIDDYFDTVVGGDTLAVRKPDPEHIFETVRRLNGNLDRSILIGDTQTDSDAAKNANVDCLLFSGGYAKDPVKSYKVKDVFHEFNELPDILHKYYSHWS